MSGHSETVIRIPANRISLREASLCVRRMTATCRAPSRPVSGEDRAGRARVSAAVERQDREHPDECLVPTPPAPRGRRRARMRAGATRRRGTSQRRRRLPPGTDDADQQTCDDRAEDPGSVRDRPEERSRSEAAIVRRAPSAARTAPLGIPSSATGSSWIASTSPIRAGEPVVTSTNHGSDHCHVVEPVSEIRHATSRAIPCIELRSVRSRRSNPR